MNSAFFRITRPLLAAALGVFALTILPFPGSRLTAQDFADLRLATADTVEPTPLSTAEQSTDFSADENAPLPVAASDSNVESAPATSIDSGIPRRFHYKFRLTVRGVYDDNINLTNTNRIEDFYTSIEPAVMVGFGDTDARVENYIRLDYLPAIFLFADHSENNSVQHVARLEAQYRVNRLTLNLSQMVQIMDGVDVQAQDIAGGGLDQQVNLDVAGRTRFNIYTTHVNVAYYVTGKMFLSAGADYSNTHYTSLISSEMISGNFFLNYNYSPKLVIGVGGTAGHSKVDEPNPDQTFEQANVRFSYQATGKVDFAATGGVEFRHFEGDMQDTHVSPVFELRMNYAPFDGTKFFVSANRRILNSAVLAAQNYEVTNISAGVQQRFMKRFFFGVNAGFEISDYFSTVGSTADTRDDHYFFVQPSIGVKVTRFWNVGAYYLRRQNDSSFDAFSFHDNQVGLRSSVEF